MPPLTKELDLFPGIALYRKGDDKKVVKQETLESAVRLLVGYVALYMAGEHELAAPFTVHGERPVVLASDWRPVPIGNKVCIVPACGDGRIPVVPNTRKVCFRHRTLEMDHIPAFVRPVLLYSRELYTTTDYGVCGTKLMRESRGATRSGNGGGVCGTDGKARRVSHRPQAWQFCVLLDTAVCRGHHWDGALY